jgi:hypothetical protein
MLKSIVEVYCIIDEIVKHGIKNYVQKGRKSKLTMSEVITIIIEGHRRNYITEKQMYGMVSNELRSYFKSIPSYAQFTRLVRKALPYVDFILKVLTEINAQNKQKFCIVDSTSLPVTGYNRKDVKWALDTAGKGKNMHGFYQGFKLHLVINQNREIVSFATTKANVHDIQVLKDHSFIKHIKGILIGDKGYIASKTHRQFLAQNKISLIATQRKNMDPYLNQYYKPLLQKRRAIESIFGYLKTRLALTLPFLRCAESFIVHVKTAILAYMIKNFDSDICYV